MSEPKEFLERFVVVGVVVESGERDVSGDGYYYALEDVSYNDAVLGRRDAAAAYAEMVADKTYRDVTVHRLTLGPALSAEEVNELFEV